ncbi:hypothetical protein FTUN_1302 [Frigoriglobus tundricola]|uniref:Uncharacterized protein n=1 Tax=Frigoriglobus tundricola TaxID=2774151 RepID=A0A6M5YKF7_9BACT|nr:hypothetical protein FTUN_1302 [Frigoriglobus tundricola]
MVVPEVDSHVRDSRVVAEAGEIGPVGGQKRQSVVSFVF